MKLIKILLTVLFIGLVSLMLWLSTVVPPSETITISTTTVISSDQQKTETFEVYKPGLRRYLEWIIIAFSLAILWIWRKRLGLKNIGPLGGDDHIQQQTISEKMNSSDDTISDEFFDLTSIDKEINDAEISMNLKHIIEMLENLRAINISSVSHKLGINRVEAKKLLYILVKNGKLRADGFPKHTIYTPVKSIENRTLDAVKIKLSKKYGELSDRRFVRLNNKYEIDAILKSKNSTFIVEAKILKHRFNIGVFERWINRLIDVVEEYKRGNTSCVLAIACSDEIDIENLKTQVNLLTLDTGSVLMEFMFFSYNELP